jgi:hypothetical protein
MTQQVLNEIIRLLDVPGASVSRDDGLSILSSAVNDLLVHNPDKLISILYRMDVSEQKIKEMLHSRPNEDAGILIAQLMIDRQEARIIARRTFKMPESDDEEEKW